MNKNNTLNISALSAERQTLVTSALIGHSVEFSKGGLSESSKESLSKVGLTSIEITAIEKANSNATDENALFKIPENTKPSSENNPYSKSKWNPEAQRQLHDENPVQAQNLMREAGILK